VPNLFRPVSVPNVPHRLAILPSPLLGPAAYTPLAERLSQLGVPTVVASLPSTEVTPARVLRGFRSAVADHGVTALVAHSNAGYYAPAVAAELTLPTIFMDAALPAEGVSETLLAPATFAAFIDSFPIHDGLLPPWPSWWERADIAALFPDEDWLDLVTRAAPRLAPDYFTTPLPVPRGWEARPAAYLAFGDTYAAELAFAEGAGWVVRREAGHHLAHLSEPDRVADLLLDLLTGLATDR
jgi:hypothetical protein